MKTYIPKKNRLLAEKLATKKYLTFLLEDLEHEKKAIEFYLRHHSSYEPKAPKLLDDSPEIQNLLIKHFSPLSKELDSWMKFPYEHNLKHPEHFGLMDNATYVKNTYGKLQLYTENQTIPSVNLITTYETKECPLGFEQVEMLINFYFL